MPRYWHPIGDQYFVNPNEMVIIQLTDLKGNVSEHLTVVSAVDESDKDGPPLFDVKFRITWHDGTRGGLITIPGLAIWRYHVNDRDPTAEEIADLLDCYEPEELPLFFYRNEHGHRIFPHGNNAPTVESPIPLPLK